MRIFFLLAFMGIFIQVEAQKTDVPESYRVQVFDDKGNILPYSALDSLASDPDWEFVPTVENDSITKYTLKKKPIRLKMKIMEPVISNLNDLQSYRNPKFYPGRPVKPFSFTTMDGKTMNISDLKGKVVVLNFWFKSCGPCNMEMPELNQLVRQFQQDEQVVFIALSLDEREELLTFLQRKPFQYTISPANRPLAKQLNVIAYPTHVVIDPNSKVVFHCEGYVEGISSYIKSAIKKAKRVKN